MADITALSREVGPFTIVAASEPESTERVLPLSHYLWVLKRRRWQLLAFVLTCIVGTFLVTRRLTPLYEAVARIDVDRQMPTGVLGQDAAVQSTTTSDADQFLATQVDLLQSDSVLRPVVESLRLKDHDPSYAASLKTPDAANAPVRLPNLKVTRSANTYLLLISYRSPDPRLAASVANSVARSYLNHSYQIRFDSSREMTRFMTGQLEELKANMEKSGQRLAEFERELNVINPEEKTSIVSESLRQVNTDYNSAKGDRMRKEAAYNAIKAGSLDAAYASSQAESLKKLSEALDEARRRFAQARLRLGENNPEFKRDAAQVAELRQQLDETRASIVQRVQSEYRQALDRETMLQASVAETKTEFDRLNARSFEYQSVKREAEADKKLYDELVRKIREAGINANFQNSSVRIADPARPPALPVFPRLKVSLLIALLGSSFLGVCVAIVTDLLDSTVRDPEETAHSLGTQVVGTLPAVRNWIGRMGPLAAASEGESLELAPINDETAMTGYGEALRTLRNSILLTDFDRRLRSILITSASPGEGKSTVAAHLAAAHAEQHHKTLLIDGDLRRPSVHRLFNISCEKGLSTVLTGDAQWHQLVVNPTLLPDLDILPAGPPSRRAADLIGKSLPAILEEACKRYDLVVLDSPPLNGFPEPLQMAAGVDGVVIVTRAGHTDRKNVAAVLSTLKRLRANVLGLVLNEVTKDLSSTYYDSNYYSSYYRPETTTKS